MNTDNIQENCVDCNNGDCDECIDGRYMPEVNIYASTCDGCGELTHHESLTMDNETQLGYCEKCQEYLNKQIGA